MADCRIPLDGHPLRPLGKSKKDNHTTYIPSEKLTRTRCVAAEVEVDEEQQQKRSPLPITPHAPACIPPLWSGHAGPLGLAEAGKLALARLAQALEHGAHLGQLGLQAGAGVVVGAPVQLLVDGALQLRRAVRRVVAQRLRDELDVERRLHERLEVVAGARPEGLEQLA